MTDNTQATDKPAEAPGHKLPSTHAMFKARYLHALRLILDDCQEEQMIRKIGLLIEPHPEGGVLVIATNGSVLAALHDPDGFANTPFRALLPPAFRAACAPPPGITKYSQGESWVEPLPEWAQPSDVHILPIAVYLSPQMDHPNDEDTDGPMLAHALIETGNRWRIKDYRIDESPLLDWRKVFSTPVQGPPEHISLNPRLMGMFDPLTELPGHEGGSLRLSFTGAETPVIVSISNLPNFIGVIMPQRQTEFPPLPVWAATAGREAGK